MNTTLKGLATLLTAVVSDIEAHAGERLARAAEVVEHA
jgi:hypothetical protein